MSGSASAELPARTESPSEADQSRLYIALPERWCAPCRQGNRLAPATALPASSNERSLISAASVATATTATTTGSSSTSTATEAATTT